MAAAPAAAAGSTNPVGFVIVGGVILWWLLMGDDDEKKKEIEEDLENQKVEFTQALSAVQNQLQQLSKAAQESAALNAQKLHDLKKKHDEMLASNKENLAEFKRQAAKELNQLKAEFEAQASTLRDTIDKQTVESQRLERALQKKKAQSMAHSQEMFELKQKEIQLKKAAVTRQMEEMEYNSKLQQQLENTAQEQVHLDAQALIEDKKLELRAFEQEMQQEKEYCGQQITQIESVNSWQMQMVEQTTKEAQISLNLMLSDFNLNVDTIVCDLKGLELEIGVQKEMTEKLSKQTSCGVSQAARADKNRVLLEKAIQNKVSDQELKAMKGILNKSSDIAAAFGGLYENLQKNQASSAKGSFVLGTGCSEVCPLIAFLQGSMKPDTCWYKECKGHGVDSAHPKVTYQFCFDQTDPSKMKVVSFAPHVHSG